MSEQETRVRPTPPPLRKEVDQSAYGLLLVLFAVIMILVVASGITFLRILSASSAFGQELVPVTAAGAAEAAAATLVEPSFSGVYMPEEAQIVDASPVVAVREAANALLDPEDRKPAVTKSTTDQWPYVTYLKAYTACRFYNESFGGLVEAATTADLRKYPLGGFSDIVDAEVGEILEIVPVNPHAAPNDSGPRPLVYQVVPCH